VGPRGSIDLSKNIRRAAEARLNVFMYITSREERRGGEGGGEEGAAGEGGWWRWGRERG